MLWNRRISLASARNCTPAIQPIALPTELSWRPIATLKKVREILSMFLNVIHLCHYACIHLGMTSQPVCKQIYFCVNNPIMYVALHVLVLWEPLNLFYYYDRVRSLETVKQVPCTVEPVKMVSKGQNI